MRAGEREVQSGERLPVGTELYAYVVPEVGKIVTNLKVNHYDDAHKQWKPYTLSQDMTFTATVADFDAEQYEELYAIDYLGQRGKIEAHTFETRTSIRNKYAVIDLGADAMPTVIMIRSLQRQLGGVHHASPTQRITLECATSTLRSELKSVERRL